MVDLSEKEVKQFSRELASALIIAAILAGYGNLLNIIVLKWGKTELRRNIAGISAPLILLAAALYWHNKIDCRTLGELGLQCRRWQDDVALGTLAGSAMALPPLIYLLRPNPGGEGLQFQELSGIKLNAFLWRLMVAMPVLVAFIEELAFRGFLQGKLQRAMPDRQHLPLLLSSLSFMLWHITVNIRTLQESNILATGRHSLARALAGGLLSVFGGGLIFGWLYKRTNSLVAPVIAHWLVDAVMLMALYYQPQHRRQFQTNKVKDE